MSVSLSVCVSLRVSVCARVCGLLSRVLMPVYGVNAQMARTTSVYGCLNKRKLRRRCGTYLNYLEVNENFGPRGNSLAVDDIVFQALAGYHWNKRVHAEGFLLQGQARARNQINTSRPATTLLARVVPLAICTRSAHGLPGIGMATLRTLTV